MSGIFFKCFIVLLALMALAPLIAGPFVNKCDRGEWDEWD